LLQENSVSNKEIALRALAERIERAFPAGIDVDEREISRIKLDVCRQYHLDTVPRNSAILSKLSSQSRHNLESYLRRRSIRTRSGIAVITAITKPFDCPHGTCIFCPGGVRRGTPQSYTANSPAASFGSARAFDPNKQVSDSLDALEKNGHDTTKVELVLLGGTILAMPRDYQEDFVKGAYEALNKEKARDLPDALRANERAEHRCVGLTIETKPDWCREEHVDILLSYGTTRVEIGVQSLNEEVLTFTNRGHTLEDTFNAFRVAKDAGLKIVAHMMPGLPMSDPDRDLKELLQLVKDERLRPDMLKIYPTLVVDGTALFQLSKMGKYRPYDLQTTIDLLCKFKKEVPRWLRIMRIQREIPDSEISFGPRGGNLRQLVFDEMRNRGEVCRCIRCREVGHRSRNQGGEKNFDDLKISALHYESSLGQEVFISAETEEVLFGFLRLRFPSDLAHRTEIASKRTAIVRELHVYGRVVPVGRPSNGQTQHRGLGTRLLAESEKIARQEFDAKKIVVISASGTREYYRKRGYIDDGAYVSKIL
jgi:elongator complex protein 3